MMPQIETVASPVVNEMFGLPGLWPYRDLPHPITAISEKTVCRADLEAG
jgi:hypothetical protein